MPTVRLPASRRWWRPGSGFRGSGVWVPTLASRGRVVGPGFRVPGSEFREAPVGETGEIRGPRSECVVHGGGGWGVLFRVPSSEFPCKRGWAAEIRVRPCSAPERGGWEGPRSGFRGSMVDERGEGPRSGFRMPTFLRSLE